MPIRNLRKIFEPKSVAVVIGVNDDTSMGWAVLDNLQSSGFRGPVHAVLHPDLGTISEGVRCCATVSDLPAVPDLAIICAPAENVPAMVRECGEKGILGIVILSVESGDEEWEESIRREARPFKGLRIIGPSSQGILSPPISLNASFMGGQMPKAGSVAFISQSGRLCTAILDWAAKENVGFSHFVSVGTMMDVGIADLIDYFATRPWTHSVILFVTSITEARDFMSAARAFARSKPIIAYKAGRFAPSAQAAASHSGVMATVDLVYDAAFSRAGVVRVSEMADIFDCSALLAKQKTPAGPRLAIVTNAGGPGIVATDALLARKGVLAQLDPSTVEKLSQVMPSWCDSGNNPVDVLDDATPERMAKAVQIVSLDRGVDAVLVIFAPQAGRSPTDAAKSVIDVARTSQKPVITSWMGGKAVEDAVALFTHASIPTYTAPEQSVRAFMYLVSYGLRKELLYETPRDIPLEFSRDRQKLRSIFECVFWEGSSNVLNETSSKSLLDAYEIPVTKPFVAQSADDAVQLANQIGYPVAMKVMSPQISHKTGVDGVVLSIANDVEVVATYKRIVESMIDKRPDARVAGVTVQKMVSSPMGVELIVGAKRDPVFGAVLLVGSGGAAAELYQDQAIELPPLSERLARRMLESLPVWPLLTGGHGRPAANIDKLIEILMRISYLVADMPEVRELDVNPLLVTPENVIALDARVVVDPQMMAKTPRLYSHLAIRPYPEEFIRPVKLKDGSSVLLRPIKPEDEPSWHDMLGTCSEQTILFRFFHLFKKTTHEMATCYCFIDYDREIAIVAEVGLGDERKLVGVGRLVADADHKEAEFAVLVADNFQGKGLGSILTDYCVEICERWGVATVVAETSPKNRLMVGIFQRRGFALDFTDPDFVLVRKKLR